MDTIALICDFAEVINGKLYIMGGGWTDVLKTRPLTLSLAVKVDVPYDRTNEPLLVEARLMNADGHPVRVENQEITVMARLEAGRPPGIKKGDPIVVPLAWTFQGLDLRPGTYSFRVAVDNEDSASARFNVRVPPVTGTPGSLA